MSTPSAFTQFCDDVRREADGRPSLMGVYPNSALIDLEGHNTLPKVCAYTVITLPFGETINSVSVVCTWNKEEVQKVDIPDTVLEDFNKKQHDEKGKKLRLMLATVIEVRDLEIGKGGSLRASVLINEKEIEHRTLNLKPQQDD